MPSIDFDDLFRQFTQIKVGVVGDIMLDTYWWGKVDRVSPEAPVPIVAVSKKEKRIGGSGNVALNLRALGAHVSVLSVLGDDEDAWQLLQLLDDSEINREYIVKSTSRITTNKIRIISRNQQMMRLDEEMTSDLKNDDEERLMYVFENFIAAQNPHVVIFEDYNKGVLTERVISRMIELCKKNNIITTVDPKRKNFFTYAGVDLFKPNLKEIKEAFNIISENSDLSILKDLHLLLAEKLHHHISLITLSEKGVFYQQGNEAAVIPTHVRNIADVSGAGDTVIAVASLVYAVTKQVKLMAQIANIAGGLVCEEVGTVAINKLRLLEECKILLNADYSIAN